MPSNLKLMPFLTLLWERRVLILLPSDPPRPLLRVLEPRPVGLPFTNNLTHAVVGHTHSSAKYFIGFPHFALRNWSLFQLLPLFIEDQNKTWRFEQLS